VEIAGIAGTADRERWSVETEVRVRRRRREYSAIAGGAGNTLGLHTERERAQMGLRVLRVLGRFLEKEKWGGMTCAWNGYKDSRHVWFLGFKLDVFNGEY
jgi:hypothetical protein